MIIKCPQCSAQRPSIVKYGNYYRTSDSRWVTRYRCKLCKKHFSNATFSPCYRQKKRRINFMILKLIGSKVSERRIALILGLSRKTVDRKIRFLGPQCKIKNYNWLKKQRIQFFQFDDLETHEHSKLKPLTVTSCVNEDYKIIGFSVARSPAKGHLAKRAVKKYGFRKNESLRARENLFKKLQPFVSKGVIVQSDQHPHYPDLVKKYFPGCEHETYKSKRSCVTGQGELKRAKFDPIFKINHTMAMKRDNIGRLVRRSWCTTKKIEKLQDILEIYMYFHNHYLKA